MDIEGAGSSHPLKRATEEFRVELKRESMLHVLEENKRLFRISRGNDCDFQPGEKLYFNLPKSEQPAQPSEIQEDLEPIRALCSQMHNLWDQMGALRQIEAILVKIRQWAGQDEKVRISVLFEERMIPKLVEFLSSGYDSCPAIQNEALWILINVLSSDEVQSQTYMLVDLGLHQQILRMFAEIKTIKHYQLGENLLWCFCNLLQSKPKLIGFFLEEGILDQLYQLAQSLPEKSDTSYTITSTLIWSVYTISALLQNSSPLFSKKVCMIVERLIVRNNYSTDQKALIKILQEFSRDRSLCLDLFSRAISLKLVAEMFNTDQTIAIPATITVCNCLSYEQVDEMQFIKAGLSEMILKLHQHQRLKEYRSLRQFITLMLGNMLCSSREVFKEATSPAILQMCLELLKDEQDSGVLFNLLEYFRIYYLVADNSALLEFTSANTNVITIILGVTGLEKSAKVNITCLIIINKILGLGELIGSNQFRDMIQDTSDSDQLERLQEHQDKIVYNFAAKIIEKYFLYDTFESGQN